MSRGTSIGTADQQAGQATHAGQGVNKRVRTRRPHRIMIVGAAEEQQRSQYHCVAPAMRPPARDNTWSLPPPSQAGEARLTRGGMPAHRASAHTIQRNYSYPRATRAESV